MSIEFLNMIQSPGLSNTGSIVFLGDNESAFSLGAIKRKPKKKTTVKNTSGPVMPDKFLDLIPGGELVKKLYDPKKYGANEKFYDYLNKTKVNSENYKGINQESASWTNENYWKGKKKTVPNTKFNPDANTITVYNPTETKNTIIDDALDTGKNIINTGEKIVTGIGDFFKSPLFLLGAGAVGILLLVVLIKK